MVAVVLVLSSEAFNETALGRFAERRFLRGSPARTAHPRFTKLSNTFFGPAFSKSMDNLLPSVAVTVP